MANTLSNHTLAKIVAIYNEKGGSGKTTTACQLAGTLGYRGFDVLVADLDPQQTSAKWLAKNEGENFPATIWPGYRYGAKVAAELEKLVTKYDIIIVDCAPSVEQPATWAVLLVSDLALIPTKLNAPDMDALPAAKNLAKHVWETSNRKFPVRVIPCATRMHMIDDKAAVESLQTDKIFPPLALTLGDRKAFSRPMMIGATAHALKGSEESVREIEALADATLKLINLPSHAKRGK
ncbi:ParA family protein [Undibacterium sp.]|uniref:ParA family protein n=1 Tax=Undibacterium sp. TaxID=1914977 RepID=UPI0027300482|nr:ParA family protein [Undibacterium sp.]MDP1978844.1 ParA family protein [Undibacterium sp.]